jgi:hypothetical protein
MINRLFIIGVILALLASSPLKAEIGLNATKTVTTQGQFSAWSHFNPSNEYPLLFGGRYLPQLNYKINLKDNHLIDFEASANLYGGAAIDPFTSDSLSGNIKPYRAWVRYSGSQFELRAGLQKINFGSASMLRPLMWFDRMDPRDPLKLTDGVWGILGRYYFLNNANLWMWGLYGNNNTKGWESIKTNKDYPEFGGRFQTPVPLGEAAISYHHRIADSRNFNASVPSIAMIPENRIGLDVRLDWAIGCWFEGSWVNSAKDLGIFTNQEVINLGLDYTFGFGSGLYMAFEQLLLSYDEKAFEIKNATSFSMLSLSYPLGMFNNLSAIIYYDWTNNAMYNFVNWQKQFNKISLYVMGYWNPKDYRIPTQGGSTNLFGGQGIQVMMVYNY